ncbi:hypothetical protein BD770DRAFT_439990 [Pilaira anomala]|nr:hypothetical protein BD770DRAFT_439990 [Pilaira anomala]
MKERNQTIDLEENKEVGDIGPEELFRPVKLQRQTGSAYDDMFGDSPEFSFTKLLETINLRAVNFTKECDLPSMDLSALYCLGLTLQEYARYMSTDLVTEKRTLEGLDPLNSLLSKKEIQSNEISAIIERYKPKKKQIHQQPNNKIPTRMPIEQEFKLKDIHHKFRLETGQSYYEDILNSNDWRHTLRKKRGKKEIERDELEAKERREQNKIRAQKLVAERAIAEEKRRIEQEKNRQAFLVQQKDNKSSLKLEEEDGDIFDLSEKKKMKSKLSKPKLKKRKMVNPF